MTTRNVNLFARLEKVDERTGEFWAVGAEQRKDRIGEKMHYARSKPNFEKLVAEQSEATLGKSKAPLRAMHRPISAGFIPDLEFDDTNKLIRIHGIVNDPVEKQKLLDGNYAGVSVGGDYERDAMGKIVWIDDPKEGKMYIAVPDEFSLADRPAMYGATFEVIKNNGALELRKIQTVATTKGDGMNTNGATQATRLEKLSKFVALRKKDYTDEERKKLAEEGKAQKDGSYPIANIADLKRAIQSWGRGGAKESDKEWIIQRAKELKATDELPEDWDGSTKKAAKALLAGNLQKLAKCYDEQAQAWQWMPVLVEPAEPSEAREESWDINSALSAMFSLTDLMAGEAESGEPDDVKLLMQTAAQLWQFILSEMQEIFEEATETPSEEEGEPLQMAVKALGLHKAAVEASALQKAGARNNADDLKRLQQIHDLAVENGAICKTEGVEKTMDTNELKKIIGDETKNFASAEDLNKVMGGLGDLQKTLSGLVKPEDMAKVVGDAVAALAKTADLEKVMTQTGELSKRLDGVEGRLQAVEKSPDPRMPVLRTIPRGGEVPQTTEQADGLIKAMLDEPTLPDNVKQSIREAVALQKTKMAMSRGPQKIG